MKKAGSFFENLCDKAVKMIILVIAGALTFWAGKYTFFYPTDYSSEWALIAADSVGKNILIFGLVLLVIYGLQAVVLRGTEEKRKKKVFIFAWTAVIMIGIGLSWFVANTHIPPYWDQAQVYLDAINFKNGDYSDMNNYLGMYPQQYGLIFLYELVFLFVKESYVVLEYFNVIFVLGIIFFSYLTCEELFHNQTVNFYCILGTSLFLPMHIYVNFVYGDLASTAFAIIGIWAVLRWRNTVRIRYTVVAVTAFIIAYLARKNTLVILIAVLLALCVDAFRRMHWKSALLGLFIFLLPLVSMSGVKLSYQWRSGNEIEKGIPAIMWMAMGMQGSVEYGCGVFNGYTESQFRGAAQSDPEKASMIAREYMSGRWEEFRMNPDMAVEFYKSKIQSQWIEPTFSSFIMTFRFGEEPTEYAISFYYGETVARLIKIMNYFNFILYVGVFCFAVAALFRKEPVLSSMGLIAVIGGFLFSIIWEAKGRYVMPYVIFLLPYMSQGLYEVQIGVKKVVLKVLGKKKTSIEASL